MKTLVTISGLILCLSISSIALASACGIVTVDTLVGTTCSIGDKTFEFTSYTPFGPHQPAPLGSAIVFTPNASNPLAPTFTLSSALLESTGTADNSFENQYAYLYFNVTVGSGEITGVNATINDGLTTSESSSPFYKPQGNLYVQLTLNGAAQMYSVENQYNDYGTQYGPFFSGSVSSVGSTASGFAYFETDAEAIASASMDSVTYTFKESAPTRSPEAGTLALVVWGLAGIAGRKVAA